ncbi:BRO family protein [Ruthenibacterium lactatiformans]|uniref:BRO family protein n=1 Tax=Ruthenibacterium lactatiformans TaxID=1550024 RepID=UPI0029433837|nr:BRO family protein [Ruthenibacterium lactatiformans]
MENDKLQLFENKKIRTAWDEEQEEWYFSIVDVVAVLTDSPNPQTYWRVMKKRLKDEGNETVTNCNALKMTAADGKKRLTDVATTEQLLRIIQSIPSPKAEPFKLWLAEVGRERIEETIDPELTIDRALDTYLKKGYSREWINQRLQAIQVRKELTDEWQDRGVQKGVEFAMLTDEITRAWSGMTTRQYKKLKGLKKENLRDNMTTLEIVLNGWMMRFLKGRCLSCRPMRHARDSPTVFRPKGRWTMMISQCRKSSAVNFVYSMAGAL